MIHDGLTYDQHFLVGSLFFALAILGCVAGIIHEVRKQYR